MIDPRAGTLITNIPLGGKPEYGVSARDGKVYANLTVSAKFGPAPASGRGRGPVLPGSFTLMVIEGDAARH